MPRVDLPPGSRADSAARSALRWLPGFSALRHYETAWLRHDLVAGLVLTTMLVPVGIAYAVASGVPGIYGLYATIVPLLAYALFGPSRIMVLGPDSSLASLILAVVLPLSMGDPARAVALAGAMAVVAGALCILAGVLRLGFVTELLSKPIRYGYMNGIALSVLISQLPKLFGFSLDADGPLRWLWAFVQALLAGRTNPTALLVGASTLAVILLLKGSKRLPGILIAVVGATIAVGAFDLEAQGVLVLGALPQGLPAFTIPWIAADRPGCGADRRCGHRPRVLRRHQRAVAQLCRTHRRPRRSEPGDGRPGCGQPGNRLLPGLRRSAAVRRARRWPRRQARAPS